jgi:hypothetical protein
MLCRAAVPVTISKLEVECATVTALLNQRVVPSVHQRLTVGSARSMEFLLVVFNSLGHRRPAARLLGQLHRPGADQCVGPALVFQPFGRLRRFVGKWTADCSREDVKRGVSARYFVKVATANHHESLRTYRLTEIAQYFTIKSLSFSNLQRFFVIL